MRHRTKLLSIRLLLMLAAGWWGILNGQVQRPVPTSFVGKSGSSDVGGLVRRSLDVGGQTVPTGAGGPGTVFPRIQSADGDDTPTQHQGLDTLELRILEVEIRKWEAKVEETGFWRRLLPQIHFSASYGMHDLMFIDPASFTSYILPRDAYRLTVSFSLNDVLMSSAHTQAIFELEKLRETLSIRRIQYAQEDRLLNQQLSALHDQLESLEKELAIVQELLRFNQLRFEQGKIEFDALARTKLELQGLQRSIQSVRHQQLKVQLKLGRR